MKQVVATALLLLLLLFLLPLLLIQDEPLSPPAQQLPQATGALPIDRTVVSPPPAATVRDGAVLVRVALDNAVEEMTMEQYLWRVVAAEMPASFDLEALKAQTVAARTYAVSKMGHTIANHPQADVCNQITCCQAYIDPQTAASNWGDKAGEYTDRIAQAVAATDGMVACYDGQPIQAVFFSSAAGRTVDAVEVWGNAVPYLSGVDSPEGEEVPNYHSTVTVPLESFRQSITSAYPESDLSGDPSGWFANIVPNSAGGVETIDVGGVTLEGGELRTLFSLRSTSFTVSAGSDGVTFSVTGYGHGVGMSQYGANALAKEGKHWQEILKWYYTGITIEPMDLPQN